MVSDLTGKWVGHGKRMGIVDWHTGEKPPAGQKRAEAVGHRWSPFLFRFGLAAGTEAALASIGAQS